MFNVTPMETLKSTPLSKDPFLKVKSYSASSQESENPDWNTKNPSFYSRSPPNTRHLSSVSFLPAEPRKTTTSYRDTVEQVTKPISSLETFRPNTLKHPETESQPHTTAASQNSNEIYQSRLINLRNELPWYDREFHALNLGERTSHRASIHDTLEKLREDQQRTDTFEQQFTSSQQRSFSSDTDTMTALEALRIQEQELRAAYKRQRYQDLNASRSDEEPSRRQTHSSHKQDKWWEWATPEFTKRLKQNRIDLHLGHTPKVEPQLPSRSKTLVRHQVAWKPQYKCPQNFDSAPHPVFGQDYPPYKRKFAGEIAY